VIPYQPTAHEEQLERIRMALAEGGHPNATVYWDHDDDGPSVPLWTEPSYVTEEACYSAFLIAGVDVPCFKCWTTNLEEFTGNPCRHSVGFEGVRHGAA
jgi:hypothetical protein